MGQDIREMFQNEEHIGKEKLRKGHQKRFEARLDEALPVENKRRNYTSFLQIAAVIVVALGIGAFFLFNNAENPVPENNQIVETPTEEPVKEEAIPTKEYRLSDVSPEFKKIEGLKLEYAVNTESAVFKDKKTYYLCDNAIWFSSSTPNGPWKVSEERPAEVEKSPQRILNIIPSTYTFMKLLQRWCM